ncbi:DinB family protein [Acinetobacter faecalis]|uniref:DinB family protein n=1 Tax=Acinetobacter faecalis TaxID=2665161 RepID=UPI002A91362C|nr:DinB family protein [Acinetobacter faecalis]MDY6482396.1 DinB family protein [Acinetobacter faecalis]
MNLDMLTTIAQYNIWATEKLCTAISQVSEEDLHSNVGLPFKSIFGTLNHLLVGEHFFWYPRFNTQVISKPVQLDSIVETNTQMLLKQLKDKSHLWVDFLNKIDVQLLNGNLSYTTTKGMELTLPYSATLLHVFNHGTHHRGQITAALTSLGYSCPELDLVYMLIEQQKDLQIQS